jgi:glycosyltransferase involved in cell wall biosynthesis
MRALRAVERRLWSLPDTILADTATHAAAWRAGLGLGDAGASLEPLPVGSPDLLGCASPDAGDEVAPGDPTGTFRVLYFGQFIPLHGVEYILGAADRLRHLPWVRFDLVGRGQTLAAAQAGAAALGLANLRIHPTWLPLAELHERFIRRADLCLGIFGHRPKAARVVPYKVYSALAAGRPVLSQDSPALREMLAPGVEVATVPPGDPDALAAAIASLAGQPGLRRALAAAGHRAWRERFSPPVLGRRMVEILEGARREV